MPSCLCPAVSSKREPLDTTSSRRHHVGIMLASGVSYANILKRSPTCGHWHFWWSVYRFGGCTTSPSRLHIEQSMGTFPCLQVAVGSGVGLEGAARSAAAAASAVLAAASAAVARAEGGAVGVVASAAPAELAPLVVAAVASTRGAASLLTAVSSVLVAGVASASAVHFLHRNWYMAKRELPVRGNWSPEALGTTAEQKSHATISPGLCIK
jgi:hypothetical protein